MGEVHYAPPLDRGVAESIYEILRMMDSYRVYCAWMDAPPGTPMPEGLPGTAASAPEHPFGHVYAIFGDVSQVNFETVWKTILADSSIGRDDDEERELFDEPVVRDAIPEILSILSLLATRKKGNARVLIDKVLTDYKAAQARGVEYVPFTGTVYVAVGRPGVSNEKCLAEARTHIPKLLRAAQASKTRKLDELRTRVEIWRKYKVQKESAKTIVLAYPTLFSRYLDKVSKLNAVDVELSKKISCARREELLDDRLFLSSDIDTYLEIDAPKDVYKLLRPVSNIMKSLEKGKLPAV